MFVPPADDWAVRAVAGKTRGRSAFQSLPGDGCGWCAWNHLPERLLSGGGSYFKKNGDMMKQTLCVVCVLAYASGFYVYAQTQVDLRTQGKSIDFAGAPSTRPMKTGASLPPSCNIGELYFLSTAASGANVYGCVAANIWAPESSPGQGGAVTSVAGRTGAISLQAADLTDCRVSQSSPTAVSLNACNFSYPNGGFWTLPGASVTILSGTGTAYIYARPEGVLEVSHSGTLVISCVDCTDGGAGNSFPEDVARIGVWRATITAGNWDPTGGTDERTLVTGSPQIQPSTGITMALTSTGGKTIGIDSAVVQTLSSAQAGGATVCRGTGAAGAQTCSLAPTLGAYTAGMRIIFVPSAPNAAAPTLNVDGLGAVVINHADGVTAVVAGELAAGNFYDLTYDGAVFRLPPGGSGAGGSGGVTASTQLSDSSSLVRLSGGSGAPSGSCTPANLYSDTASANSYICAAAGTWVFIGRQIVRRCSAVNITSTTSGAALDSLPLTGVQAGDLIRVSAQIGIGNGAVAAPYLTFGSSSFPLTQGSYDLVGASDRLGVELAITGSSAQKWFSSLASGGGNPAATYSGAGSESTAGTKTLGISANIYEADGTKSVTLSHWCVEIEPSTP